MHETGIAVSLLHIVLEESQKYQVNKISRIVLHLGIFNAIETHALQAAFELLAENTAAEGAELFIARIPADASCQTCKHGFQLKTARPTACPQCGATTYTYTGGNCCLIQSIEAYEKPVEQTL